MRTLYIIRGIPGTGKTTLANQLTEGDDGIRHSADDFFYNEDGEYQFDKERLPEAHQSCQWRVKKSMQDEIGRIAVDNTNIELWQVAPYLNMALDYGYTPVIIKCETNFGSIHDVPVSTIEDMREKYQPTDIYRSASDLEKDRSHLKESTT